VGRGELIRADDVDPAAVAGCLGDFVGDAAAEGREVDGAGLEGELAGLDAAQKKDFVDKACHVAGGVCDVVEVFRPARGFESVEVGFEHLSGGEDDADGGAELVGDEVGEVGLEADEFPLLFEGALKFLFRSFALDGEGGLIGDEREDLLVLGAEGGGVVVVLHGHDADGLATDDERDAEPDGSWGAALDILAGRLEAGDFLEIGEAGAPGAEDVFGDAWVALARSRGWVDFVDVVGEVEEAGIAIEKGDVEIPGGHQGADDLMDAPVKGGEVVGLVHRLRDLVEGLLDPFGTGAFGDLFLEAGIGGLDFGGAFVDAAFQVTVKGAQGFLGADADKFVGEECGEGGENLEVVFVEESRVGVLDIDDADNPVAEENGDGKFGQAVGVVDEVAGGEASVRHEFGPAGFADGTHDAMTEGNLDGIDDLSSEGSLGAPGGSLDEDIAAFIQDVDDAVGKAQAADAIAGDIPEHVLLGFEFDE